MDGTENQLKYENYREQFKRLKSALNSGFNLEAAFMRKDMKTGVTMTKDLNKAITAVK